MRSAPGLEAEAWPPIYQPSPPHFMTFVAHVRGRVEDSLAACRDAVQSVDRNVPVFGVHTLEDRLTEALARPRFYTIVVLFFGGFALLIAMIGIYGAVSNAIAQRKHEIGVRLAIGATSPAIRMMVLRNGLLPLLVGTVVGLAGAAALGKSLEHLLESAQRVDLVTSVVAASFLIAVALSASWIATRRVLRLDPIQVLRTE